MKYTGPVFRPPLEARTVLLQVTVGCAHNQCSFCTMYKNTDFSIEQIDQIEEDLKEVRATYRSLKRLFLINGDAFVLSARRLKIISDKIIEYFPEMETITMYASVRNIMDKSDEELKLLKASRINDLWVGIETGNKAALDHLNKGYSLKDAYEQLARLNTIGIRHNGIYMMGTSGKDKGIENAIDTAKLINDTKPQLVRVTTLGIFPGSEFEKEVHAGTFIPATELEVLEEEKKLIELIEIENIPFNGTHPINMVNINGLLPRDRASLIQTINEAIESSNSTYLNSVTSRSTL